MQKVCDMIVNRQPGIIYSVVIGSDLARNQSFWFIPL